jgi:2-polyprenyl-6-methoxyphenol hydroxylase-like FAD-dependent oxidoreductase
VTASGGAGPDILVVGAGPTGLLLAAELQRRGVRCLVVDAKAEPNHWDRATVVHPRSLELFESLGLVDQFLTAGTPQRGAKLHADGEVLGAFDTASAGSRYEFDVGVSEEVTESILTAYLQEQGGEVHRASKLVGLTAGADAVRAEIEHDGASYEVEVQWVVGCGGLHSPTRAAIGVEYEGHDIAEPWAVFDAAIDGWPETYDVTFVYLDAPSVILTALPDRRWRVYLRPSAPDSDLVADAEGTLRAYYPDVSFVDVENPTRFRCQSEVAERFRSGRVLLAGDAAHLCSPSQGHGMNTGLQDGANLAWKLALVLRGAADPALLDSY